jgi:predicted nuclease with TOPRIM domain
MSEIANVDEGQQSNAELQKETINIEELTARLAQLESTNNRLLDENKKIKSKYKETSSAYEIAEREKLEKEGNWQAVVEAERKKRESLEQENKEFKGKMIRTNLNLAVSKYAAEVHDLEDLLNQPKFTHILTGAIDSENMTIDDGKVKEYVNEVLKAKPYMKRNLEIPQTVTTRPGMQAVADKKPEEMTSKELEDYIKKLYN